MQGLNRLVSVLATCVASLAVVAVLACDKDGGGAPPAPAGDGKPAATTPETATPPVGGDAPPAQTGAPNEGTGSNVTCTADTRKGGMCTREYSPVCGTVPGRAARVRAGAASVPPTRKKSRLETPGARWG